MTNHLYWNIFGGHFLIVSPFMVCLAVALTYCTTIGAPVEGWLNRNNSGSSLISLLFKPSTLDIAQCRIRLASPWSSIKSDNGSPAQCNAHWHKTTLEQNPTDL